MDFEWNEAKRELNLTKHGVDVFVAALIFEGHTIKTEDKRHDYGELRYKSIGMVDDTLLRGRSRRAKWRNKAYFSLGRSST